jgi:hypothetical protein
MEWSCALYRAVQEHDMSQAEAAVLVETTMWDAFQPVPAALTGVAFDVTLCPLADYFKDQGVPELTEPAAGNLDYRMAREWGVELVRTQTIADGAAYCDFRWKFPAAGAD